MGKWITESLLELGNHKITAITREDSTAPIPSGVHATKVNYADHQTLVNALKGQDVLIITLPADAAPDTQNKLVDAAADAGIQWIVPNEFGGDGTDDRLDRDTFIGVPKRKARQHIEDKGLSWIGVACGFWYDFSLAGGVDRYGFDLKNKTLLLYDEGETRIPTSTWPLTAEAVARLLALPLHTTDGSPSVEDYKNKFLRVASFVVNQKEMFASVLRVTGDKESDWTITKTPVVPYYQEAVKLFQETGDRRYFGRLLYSRGFFTDTNWAARYVVDNEKLGLQEEDMDHFTKSALEMDRNDYFKNRYYQRET